MRIPTLVLSAILFGAMPLLATDRVVSTSGTYNTISSAIAASSDGDRVLISPGTYDEYLTISSSITLVPQTEGTSYTLLKTLRINDANGKRIVISGATAQTISLTGNYSTPTVISIIDSHFTDCNLQHPFVRVELLRNTIDARAFISAGIVVGCTFTASISDYLLSVNGPTDAPAEVIIAGNIFGALGFTGEIYLNTTAPFRIENNYLHADGTPFLLEISEPLVEHASRLINNTIRRSTFAISSACTFFGSHEQNLIIKNNVTVNFGGGMFVAAPPNSATQASNNMLAAPSWINTTTGESLAGTPLLNAGDPDPRYLDLDLTTNDVGCYGGSNSRANFTTGMGSAVVGFMQAPRVVAQGEAVQISAVGFDR